MTDTTKESIKRKLETLNHLIDLEESECLQSYCDTKENLIKLIAKNIVIDI